MQETIKISQQNSSLILDLKELWSFRELLYFLTLRDIKVRYKQTAIGIIWAILQPVLTTAIFTVIFSSFAKFESVDIPYPLFALSGLLIWLFVNTAITSASNSLIGHVNLVTKVYFPRLIVPFSAAFAGLVDLIICLALLLGLMLYYGVPISGQIVFAPLFILLATILALSLGTLFSALNVRFRDVKHALPFALQIWMFSSAIFFPLSSLSEKWRFWLSFNPLIGILEGFRSSIFGNAFDWRSIVISISVTLVLFVVSMFVFKHLEDDFADLI